MEDKKTAAVLKKLLNKNILNAEEKEAVLAAIGLLDLSLLAQKSVKRRFKLQKEKKDKAAKW